MQSTNNGTNIVLWRSLSHTEASKSVLQNLVSKQSTDHAIDLKFSPEVLGDVGELDEVGEV